MRIPPPYPNHVWSVVTKAEGNCGAWLTKPSDVRSQDIEVEWRAAAECQGRTMRRVWQPFATGFGCLRRLPGISSQVLHIGGEFFWDGAPPGAERALFFEHRYEANGPLRYILGSCFAIAHNIGERTLPTSLMFYRTFVFTWGNVAGGVVCRSGDKGVKVGESVAK